MLPRFVKTAEAPADVAMAAVAADRTYRHFRMAYTERRNAAIQGLTDDVRVDQKLVSRLARAFNIQPNEVWSILNSGSV